MKILRDAFLTFSFECCVLSVNPNGTRRWLNKIADNIFIISYLAEREGFEPPDLLSQRFSRPPHSTALPSLRRKNRVREGNCKIKKEGLNNNPTGRIQIRFIPSVCKTCAKLIFNLIGGSPAVRNRRNRSSIHLFLCSSVRLFLCSLSHHSFLTIHLRLKFQ